jgi:hypothetical protein
MRDGQGQVIDRGCFAKVLGERFEFDDGHKF